MLATVTMALLQDPFRATMKLSSLIDQLCKVLGSINPCITTLRGTFSHSPVVSGLFASVYRVTSLCSGRFRCEGCTSVRPVVPLNLDNLYSFSSAQYLQYLTKTSFNPFFIFSYIQSHHGSCRVFALDQVQDMWLTLQ